MRLQSMQPTKLTIHLQPGGGKYLSVPTNKQHHTTQLPPQILLLHIMRILHLTPHARLPSDLCTTRLSRLLNPKPPLPYATTAKALSIVLQMSELLTPLHHQPRRHKQALTRQRPPLQRRKLIRRQARDPAADDTLRHLGLLLGHDGGLV